MALISIALIQSVQHLYFIVGAPAFFIPLGVVILSSDVLPHALGYLAIALGVVFAIAGVVFLFDLTLPVLIQASTSIQALWWLAAAIVLIVRPEKIPNATSPSDTT